MIKHTTVPQRALEVWVFGKADVSHTPALGYMEIVQQGDAATLLIIQAHTAPGTTVHSNDWSAYRRVASLPNVASHSTVNHSLHFIDPKTGTHALMAYWQLQLNFTGHLDDFNLPDFDINFCIYSPSADTPIVLVC